MTKLRVVKTGSATNALEDGSSAIGTLSTLIIPALLLSVAFGSVIPFALALINLGVGAAFGVAAFKLMNRKSAEAISIKPKSPAKPDQLRKAA